MAHAQDMGGYYRIPADNRDLNYAKYFSEGEEKISHLDDYTSHNTNRLNVEQIKALLLKLDFIKEELNAESYDHRRHASRADQDEPSNS
jgi:UDP-glucose 4-epimerase